MSELSVNIVIPTFNRAATCLGRAIDGALAQSYSPLMVTVIDDGSDDDTARVVRRYQSEPRFSCIRLGRNVGTAQAKNVAIMCCPCDAISFHDSDDVPSLHKILLQARALELRGHRADAILDWRAVGVEPGAELEIDIVVGAYELIKMDGTVHYINKRISLVDDFFPNVQFPSKTEGDWCLINAGLFRRRVFERLGGFLDSVEEDRELRNRTIAAGCLYYFIDRSLFTKLEMADSLTIASETGFTGQRRLADRNEVWRRNQLYRRGVLGEQVREQALVTVDLVNVAIEEVINPANLRYNHAIPATQHTRDALSSFVGEVDGLHRVAHLVANE